MARAGYDPNEALRFWSRMAGDKNDQEIPELLSTHPTSDTRIAKLAEYLPRARSNYNLAKVKYGLGETFDIKPAIEEKEEGPEKRPQPVPGVSVETLTSAPGNARRNRAEILTRSR